jgi:putative membrane protein
MILAGSNPESPLGAALALTNAVLNGTAALLLFSGWIAIRKRRPDIHWKLMTAAFVVSCIFLACYLTRFYISGAHRYPGHGTWKAIYLSVLVTHMILAAATPPLAIRTLWLAAKKRIPAHRRLVRYTLPIWMYVSVTGVIVYLLLYHPPG